MKTLKSPWFLSLLGLSALVLFGLLFLRPATEPQNESAELTAQLNELQGDVRLRQPDQEDYLSATDGEVLRQNGNVRTLDDGRTRLDLSDGAIVRLGPRSDFTLEYTRPHADDYVTRVRLAAGMLWLSISGGSLEVNTPSGLASVSGSYLSVAIDSQSGDVLITCLEGVCGLTSRAGSVNLIAGQTARIKQASVLPETGLMNPADVEDWLKNFPEATVIIPVHTATVAAYQQQEATATPDAVTDGSTATVPLTPTPGFMVLDDVDCHTGPGDKYPLAAVFAPGNTAEVVGQNPNYWVVKLPINPDLRCWVLKDFVDANLSADDVPTFSSPPLPTITPSGSGEERPPEVDGNGNPVPTEAPTATKIP